MTLFWDWIEWKRQQGRPTCDYIGCHNEPRWFLPRQKIYFCSLHSNPEKMCADYGEAAELCTRQSQ